MRTWIQILLAVVCCAIANRVAADEETVRAKAEYLLRGCEASRLRLRVGDCVVTGNKWEENDQTDVRMESAPVRYRVAFDHDNDNVRYEFREPRIATVQEGSPGDPVTAGPQVVYREAIFARTRDAATIYQTGDGLADNMCSIFSPENRRCPPGNKCFDPRCISFCGVRQFWGGATLSEVAEEALNHLQDVAAVDTLDGGVSKIVFRYPSSRTEIEIVESKDFAPIRFTVIQTSQNGDAGGDSRSSAATQVEDFEISRVVSEWSKVDEEWVPVKLETSFRTASLNQSERMDLSLDWKSINRPLDASLYSYTSFGLKPGTTVIDDRLPRDEHGGAAIIAVIQPPMAPVENSPRAQQWGGIFWLNISAAFLLLAFFIVWRSVVRRPSR